ncbi:MAG: hypothetical protein NVS3B21_15040 [Acidimicrobiales bacterium]
MTLKEFFDRYAPTIAVIGALALLVLLLPSNSKKTALSASNTGGGGLAAAPGAGDNGGGGGGSGSGATGGPLGGGPGGAVSSAGGGVGGSGSRSAAGGVGGGGGGGAAGVGGSSESAAAKAAGVKFGSGPHCRPDTKQQSISLIGPPCADWVKGSPNGGATGKGVTGDKILVIRYLNYVDPATKAALVGAGANDDDPTTERQFQAEVTYFNQHYETYGRQVVMQSMAASGHDDNEEAMRADAVKMAEEKKAFAVITTAAAGPPILARELASRGVVCMCTVSLSSTFYTSLKPYIFSSLPTGEEYYAQVAEYIGKRLAGGNRKAKYAGDAAFKVQSRKFGLIWYEGAMTTPEPGYKAARDFFIRELGKYGVSLSAEFSYLFDISKAGEQSTSMIAKMKSAGVTTVIPAVDPLYPIFFTQEATKQNYFPEWFDTGTALTDTTFFGRTYDKAQWQHAFGISPLSVPVSDFSKSAGYREYHHGHPDDKAGDEGVAINVVRAPVSILFSGIHMAGPTLNADNFAAGAFSFPPVGGDPTHPLISFSRAAPTAIKDFSEIYWDSTSTGKDEVNKQGAGLMLRTEGGKRHPLGSWSNSDPVLFDRAASHAVFDASTEEPRHEQDGHRHNTKCLSCP